MMDKFKKSGITFFLVADGIIMIITKFSSIFFLVSLCFFMFRYVPGYILSTFRMQPNVIKNSSWQSFRMAKRMNHS